MLNIRKLKLSLSFYCVATDDYLSICNHSLNVCYRHKIFFAVLRKHITFFLIVMISCVLGNQMAIHDDYYI